MTKKKAMTAWQLYGDRVTCPIRFVQTLPNGFVCFTSFHKLLNKDDRGNTIVLVLFIVDDREKSYDCLAIVW